MLCHLCQGCFHSSLCLYHLPLSSSKTLPVFLLSSILLSLLRFLFLPLTLLSAPLSPPTHCFLCFCSSVMWRRRPSTQRRRSGPSQSSSRPWASQDLSNTTNGWVIERREKTRGKTRDCGERGKRKQRVTSSKKDTDVDKLELYLTQEVNRRPVVDRWWVTSRLFQLLLLLNRRLELCHCVVRLLSLF